MFEINITTYSIQACLNCDIHLVDDNNQLNANFYKQCKEYYDNYINIKEPNQSNLTKWIYMCRCVVGIRQRMKFINYIANL